MDKNLKFYVIDGYSVARETGMGNRINTIMQTCFFAISGVLPREDAIAAIKAAIKRRTGSAATRSCRRIRRRGRIDRPIARGTVTPASEQPFEFCRQCLNKLRNSSEGARRDHRRKR